MSEGRTTCSSASSSETQPGHGLPERTVSEIRQCIRQHFPQLHWVKLYGSRAMGRHWRGSDIDLAFSADENCSAALHEALDELPTPYLFDVTHWESLHHSGLREHIQRVGIPFPDPQP
jgi:predicted nucleotidyltransferase